MNLVTQFLTDRRDRLLMRLGCWLVIFSLVIGLMLPQQKADALVTELAIGSVAALAASYLCACGLPLVTQGMDRDALVSYVQRLIQEFLDTELGGKSIQDWLGSVWDLAVIAGKLVMGRPLTDEFAGFAQWVAGKYVVQVGENAVYNDKSITLADGSALCLTSYKGYYLSGNHIYLTDFSIGTIIADVSMSMPSPGTISSYWITDTIWLDVESPAKGNFKFWSYIGNSLFEVSSFAWQDFYTLVLAPDGFLTIAVMEDSSVYLLSDLVLFPADLSSKIVSGSGLSIDARSESMSYMPEGIEAEQGIALDVGAAATMDLDMVLQGVLDDVLAGELTSTMEAAGEEVVDPPAEELPDVDELGLPALGAALTSRFPFSIPWDFFRAVKLVAAPAKAPRFEVDFMAPIEHRVGQWQGDTTIVLDFSEYAIIGQISRWTSTIGFCLMLAGATKRLIWTA